MCRSIKVLRSLEPPATYEDAQAAARQYVRKISGFRQPSQKNIELFEQSVEEIAKISMYLLERLVIRVPSTV